MQQLSSRDSSSLGDDSGRDLSYNARRDLSSSQALHASTSASSSRKKSILEHMTLAQLHLTNMRLHGREDDLILLKSKLSDLIDGKCKRPELLLVSGISGTGKSALVMKGLRDPAQKLGLIFASGKFDLNNAALPLSAFIDAMASLTKNIVSEDLGEDVRIIRDHIREEFTEDDQALLLRTMPGCVDLFHTRENNDVDASDRSANRRGSFMKDSNREISSSSSAVGKEAILRLQYAIRRLLKIIGLAMKGIVLFIDDLQWSDTSTLDLIQSILLDVDLQSIILVGAYRKDEMTESHPLMLHIREISQLGGKQTTINVGNLSSDNVQSLIAEALAMEDEENKVSSLAEIVHKKTSGNAFFVLIFLRSLHEEELLAYNFGAMRWVWNDDEVEAKLMMSNVAFVLVNKLKRFSAQRQVIMQIAACLGASFSTDLICVVASNLWRYFPEEDSDVSAIVSDSVKDFVKEGLWEQEDNEVDVAQFAHDQIQSAALDLIENGEIDSFKGEIGGILTTKLDPDTIEDNLFVIVSLRNCGKSSLTRNERRILAQMNLRAGLKSADNAAFDSAAIYYKEGCILLGATSWQEDFSLMLRLCSEGANVAFITGAIGEMKVLIDLVLGWPQIPFHSKYRLYEVKILALQSTNNFYESMAMVTEVRRQLELFTPPNKPTKRIHVIKEYMKTMRMLKNRSAQDIASLPVLSDTRMIYGNRMLELMALAAESAQPSLFPLISFLLVQSSIKYGLNASSCFAFASLGFIQCNLFNKLQEGREMVKAVELLLASGGEMNRMKARAFVFTQSTILPYTTPLQETLSPAGLLQGYQAGLEIGDTESAALNLSARCWHLFYASRKLDVVLDEVESYMMILAQLNSCKMCPMACFLAIKKLRGIDSRSSGILIEDESFEAIVKYADENSKQGIKASAITARLELLVIFGEWQEALSLLTQSNDLHLALCCYAIRTRFTYLEALVYIKSAQKAESYMEKRKWEKKGKQAMKLISTWVKKGSVNLVHSLHLLTAELAIVQGSKKKVDDSYKLAIKVATKHGFIQDRALAHELASAFFAAEYETNNYWSQHHLKCAKQSYVDWGATAKVEQMSPSTVIIN